MKNPEEINFGERLREVMDTKNITVLELSRESGIQRSDLYRYLNETAVCVTIQTVQRLAKALKIDPARLVGWGNSDVD